MTLDDIKQLGEMGGLALLGALVMGRTFRRIILWPFHWLAGKTKTKADDIIVHDAEIDAGLISDEEKEDGDK